VVWQLSNCKQDRFNVRGVWLLSGLGNLGMLRSLVFKDCGWLGDMGPNRPHWCPSLTGLTSLTELVFDHCPMLNTLPDAVRPRTSDSSSASRSCPSGLQRPAARSVD
jgi:hypothetical protein